MAEAVRRSHAEGSQVILLGSTLGMAERLRDILHEYGVPFRSEFGEQPLKAADEPSAPIVGIGKISAGLRLPDAGLEIYAETDIFDESEHLPQHHRRRQKISAFLSDLQDLKPGDYVVHVDHGIGTYNGITLVHDKECMVLLYQGGDRLYVPLERLDLVQKYSSTEGARPQLDKLGGTTWIARKTRAKRAIRDMAQELLKLYAERKVAGGLRVLAGYGMAEGIRRSVSIRRDAGSAHRHRRHQARHGIAAADGPAGLRRRRLRQDGSGDARGFQGRERRQAGGSSDANDGSLLPALRNLQGAFRGVSGHDRDAQPVCASKGTKGRFVADVEAGKVDIVIGTHRLLSKDVKFQDLGLMIVDEEQRFGVAHKERLKQIKKQVDVLTMTATPIPRTLTWR